jgi:2-amino-4-hydroxy-6-hydroxymethyldihydropteridine diphosphokinase
MTAETARTTVFVTLGSNIEPHDNIHRAFGELSREFDVEAVSGVWESAPHGAPGTPRFLNAAVRITCDLSPRSFKARLRRIETRLGRRRGGDRNAPRTIDLDMALFGNLVIDDPAGGLRIPDPEVLTRAYLALPLAEVGPRVPHPETGEPLAEIATRLASGPEAPRAVPLRPGSAVAGS